MMRTVFCILMIIATVGLNSACRSASRSEASAKTVESADSSSHKEQSNEKKAQLRKDENSLEQTEQKPSEKVDNSESSSGDSPASNASELRCGWYSNPTPANHWLEDRDGEWIIGIQGGQQADGKYPPNFKPGEWVKTNGDYGYGCACLRVRVDRETHDVLEVISSYSRPLSVCRKDRSLREPKD